MIQNKSEESTVSREIVLLSVVGIGIIIAIVAVYFFSSSEIEDKGKGNTCGSEAGHTYSDTNGYTYSDKNTDVHTDTGSTCIVSD